MHARRPFALLLAILGLLVSGHVASAATLTVDDDKAQCPGAQYTKIQTAIDAAFSGDTIAVCPGTYVEGNGAVATNALTISFKNLDIRGAGADLVAIQPKRSTATGGRIADTQLDLRNGVGDIVSVIGSKAFPTTVNISGVTIDGNGVYVEGGVVYRDGGGTLLRDRVTNIVTSEADTAGTLDGGYRSDFPGVGVAQLTSGAATPAAVRPALNIVQSRINRYNKYGVLVSSATGEGLPLTNSTVTNTSTFTGDQIVGRTQCTAFNTPTAPPYVLGTVPGATPALQLPGNCSSVGLTTTGMTFGQDGIRVAGGSTAAITDTSIFANLVNGTGAPAYNAATNNTNLALGAGVRLLGAGASTITNSNIVDNAYGVFNAGLDGTTANTAVPVSAENVFWGLRTNATLNAGPAVSPLTNPPYQENPVNGTATVDATCLNSSGVPVPGSDAVDFCPFRNGNQADPNSGEWPVAYAPLPISDAAPSVLLSTGGTTFDRGAQVTLSADARDDFAVARISFFNGLTQLASVVPPAGSTTFTVPSDAACGAQYTFSAVVQDSAGQTSSDSKTITVGGPSACPPPPTVTPTNTPTVTVTDTPTVTVTNTPTVTVTTTPTVTVTDTPTVTVTPTATIGPPTPTPTATVTATATPTPPPAGPAAPTISLSGIPSKLGAKGATATAVVTTDPALKPKGVLFRLGTRSVCFDATAPYTCRIVPRGVDVGDQTVTASTTDTAGQTATDDQQTTVRRFASRVSVHVMKDHKPDTLIRTISGRVSFSTRVSRSLGCVGTVTLTVKKNGRTIVPLEQRDLSDHCRYSLKVSTPRTRRHRFTVDVQFGGNDVLATAQNDLRFK